MEINSISAALWYAGIALKAILVATVLIKGVHREHPIFAAYVVALFARSVALGFISSLGTYPAYFYTYWIGQVVLVGLGFALVWEIYSRTLGRFPKVHQWTGLAFGLGTAVLLLFGIGSVMAAPATASEASIAVLLAAQRTVWVIQSGLLLLLVGIAGFGYLSFRTQSFGIALGLGIYSAAQVAVFAVLATGADGFATSNVMAQQLGFIVGAATWITYFVTVREVDYTPAELQAWTEAVAQLSGERVK